MATTILHCVVGSRLHGLEDEKSDTDHKSIVMLPLRSILSPFGEGKVKHGDKDGDDAAYELRHFLKLLAGGNPTIWEVAVSNKILFETPEMVLIRDNLHRFLNSAGILNSHIGYAKSQMHKIEKAGVNSERIGKAACAYIRILNQGVQLLNEGMFSPQAPDHLRELLVKLKKSHDYEYVMNLAAPWFHLLEAQINEVYQEHHAVNPWEVDREWIEEFVLGVYQ